MSNINSANCISSSWTSLFLCQVSALNEATPGSVKSVFKAWEHRLNSSGVNHSAYPLASFFYEGTDLIAPFFGLILLVAMIHLGFLVSTYQSSPYTVFSLVLLAMTGLLGKQWGWPWVTCFHSVSCYFWIFHPDNIVNLLGVYTLYFILLWIMNSVSIIYLFFLTALLWCI